MKEKLKKIFTKDKEMPITDYHDFSWPDMPKELREKLDIGPIYLNGIICGHCGYFARSKNRHHMASCKCKKTSIDGGSWYGQITGDDYKLVRIEFNNL
jgi:hypothetical protein